MWTLHVEDFFGLLNTLELHDSNKKVNDVTVVIIIKHKTLEDFVCLFYYDGYIETRIQENILLTKILSGYQGQALLSDGSMG